MSVMKGTRLFSTDTFSVSQYQILADLKVSSHRILGDERRCCKSRVIGGGFCCQVPPNPA